ncbi:MAG TPA: hypothetical protein VI894_03760 [Candidatus Nanoarchaeia archaeon]|nr:hypothetical protein [Candidatus Nanoarchaeia archaeon]
MTILKENELESIFSEKGKVNLIVVETRNAEKVREEILEVLNNKKISGIYCLIGLRGTVISEKANNRIKIIDCGYLAKTSVAGVARTLISCSSLSELSIGISQEIQSIQSSPGKCDFVILDSVNSIFHFNDEERAMRFMHFISNKLRALSKNLILIFKDDGGYSKKLSIIKTFIDVVHHQSV